MSNQQPADRRECLKAGALGAAAIGLPAIIRAQTVTNAIKVGLVGCGGRGTGAASQALRADDLSELVAVADVTQAQVDKSLETLKKIPRIAPRVKVEAVNQYLGLDAFQKVIDSGADVILLAT